MIRRLGIVISLLAALFQSTVLTAEAFRTFESPLPLETLRWKALGVLDKIDRNNYAFESESQGFAYSYYNLRTSAFSYRIYGGTLTEKQPTTLLRVEGRTGDVYVLGRVFQQEGLVKIETPTLPNGDPISYAPLSPKYHLIGQPLNLIAPWLGVLHASYDSPRLTTGQTVFRFTMYFGVDAVLVWAAGRNFFRDSWNPQKYAGNIAAVLVVPRIVGAVQSFNLIRGHNRLAELKYTFPIN